MCDNVIVRFKDVCLDRGGRRIFSGVNWTMKKGENWFMMGNNGSGKTSFIELIMGYLWPGKGTISVFGERFGRTYIPDIRKRIGYVSPWVSVRMDRRVRVNDVIASGTNASVGFFGKINKGLLSDIEDLLSFFGMRGYGDKKFSELSSGEQLKVMLARALVNRPALLILDEPFSLLDIGARAEMYDHITTLLGAGRDMGILLITHHLEDILPVFSHGLFLKDGDIAVQGKRGDVLTEKALFSVFGVKSSLYPAAEGPCR
ncbi:MAG: ATP-binding cassette domain-containing protein [Candidatus Omnitrophica bacterium]|nr:ATP-binding cassette domain-containing protein [Candidatus Omnitrophota bacterium]MDD5487847.1 ATP-binding cassette domain-containing protein [Candidatus Omnitrophota bacterium]